MSKTLCALALAATLVSSGIASAVTEDEVIAEFDGRGDSYNLFFSVDGPWRVRWEIEATGSFPSFELRLTDAGTGRPLGVVVQTSESESKRRTFEYPGRFHFDVLARDVRWEVTVMKVPQVTLTLPEDET